MKISMTGAFGGSASRGMPFLRDYAVACEQLGYTCLYSPEHVVFFPKYTSAYPYTPDGSPSFGPRTGVYDPLFVAAAGAAVTKTLRFASSVMILPERPALLVAKEVMTLEHLTGGRFDLGIGIGWSSEEYAALDMPFDQRGKRCDEYIEAMRLVWKEDLASYHGQFVNFDDVVLLPHPTTHIPIVVGGESDGAMRRATRLCDGWYGFWAGYELEPHLAKLRGFMERHGRSQSDGFEIRLGLPIGSETPDDVARKAEVARSLGVDELVLAPAVRTTGFEETLRSWAEAVGLSA